MLRMAQHKLSGILKLLILVIFIVVINFLSFQYNQWYDLTETNEHSLSPRIIKVLSELKEPVQILCFFHPNDERQYQVKVYLDRLQAHSPLISYKFHNPETDFNLMKIHNLDNYGMVFINQNHKYQVYKFDEADITLGLIKVTRPISATDTFSLPTSSTTASVKSVTLNFLQISFIILISVIIIPLAFVAIGFSVWWQRR